MKQMLEIKKISTKKFDKGEYISKHLNFSSALKINEFEKAWTKTRKVNVNFPEHIIMQLDKKTKKIGVTRQSIIKVWIAERLKEEKHHQLVY